MITFEELRSAEGRRKRLLEHLRWTGAVGMPIKEALQMVPPNELALARKDGLVICAGSKVYSMENDPNKAHLRRYKR